MNSRKNFLKQALMATAGLMIVKPFSTFASLDGFIAKKGTSKSFNLFYTNNSFRLKGNKLSTNIFRNIAHNIKDLKTQNASQLWLDAGYVFAKKESGTIENEDFLNIINDVNNTNIAAQQLHDLKYSVIEKGNSVVGLINLNENNLNEISDLDSKIHSLADHLKKEQKCLLVILVALKNDKSFNLNELAENSTNIDVVLKMDEQSKNKITTIKNKIKEEVILINQAGEIKNVLKSIEIGFDDQGVKNSIRFSNVSV